MNKQLAQLIVRLIPATCPFNKTIRVAGLSFTVPSICKLNPFYDQLINLRCVALSKLDESN